MHFLFCYRVDNAIVGASTFHLQLSPAASNSVGLNSPNFFAAKLFVYREYVTAFVKFLKKKKKQPLVSFPSHQAFVLMTNVGPGSVFVTGA